MAHEVFISYSFSDKAVAEPLCAALERNGLRCWMAPRDVMVGRPFSGQIKRAIEDCKLVVLIFSADSNSSQHVLREVQIAAGERRRIVNFRIEDIEPCDDMDYYLTLPQRLDAFPPPADIYHAHLVRSVRTLLDLGDSVIVRKAQKTKPSDSGARAPQPPPLPREVPPPPSYPRGGFPRRSFRFPEAWKPATLFKSITTLGSRSGGGASSSSRRVASPMDSTLWLAGGGVLMILLIVCILMAESCHA